MQTCLNVTSHFYTINQQKYGVSLEVKLLRGDAEHKKGDILVAFYWVTNQ